MKAESLPLHTPRGTRGTAQMTDRSEQTWPKAGFEPLIDYRSSFIHLNINLGSQAACHRYHDDWIRRYRASIATWADYDVALRSVRCRQSLKLCFSATYFALSASEARNNKVLASSYYLAYYSMLHAMWAVLFLHPDQTIDAITDITHSKIANVFHSCFANGIIKADAKELAEDLRFLREYYSYRMPLNSPFAVSDNISDAHIHLGGFVKQSIQLANLHSHLLFKTAERLKRTCARIGPEDRVTFRSDFFRINGKQHPARGLKLLDPADKQAEYEYLTQGCDLVPLSIAYEHMFDDFMSYDDEDRPNETIIRETSALVANALF
jgi:hypothetical protein